MRRRTPLILAVPVALAAVWWLVPDPARAPGSEPVPRDPGGSPREVDAATTRAMVPDPEFVCLDEDGAPLPVPPRDGLVVAFLGPGGAPLGAHLVEVRWRKGYANYGTDRGRCTEDGRFATTVARPDMIEGVAVPDFGGREFRGFGPFDPRPESGEVVVRIPRLVAVQGRVLDTTGAGVAGVSGTSREEQTLDAPGLSVLRVCRADFTTDAGGGFELRVPEGFHHLQLAQTAGVRLLHSALVHANGAAELLPVALYVHRLGTGRTIRVSIDVPDGAAADAVQVSAGSDAPVDGLQPAAGVDFVAVQRRYEVARVAGGGFEVRDCEPATVRVRGTLAGYRGAVAEVLPGADGAHLRFVDPVEPQRPDPRMVVTGEVRDASGPVRSGILVRLVRDERFLWGDSAETGRDGSFSIATRPGRPAVVFVRDGGRQWFFGPFDLRQAPERLRLTLGPADAVIRGRVVDGDGKPVGARIQVFRRRGLLARLDGSDPGGFLDLCPQEAAVSSDVKADGRFEVGGLPAGAEVALEAMQWDHTSPPGRVVCTAGSEGVLIVMGRGFEDGVQVHGRITCARTGAGIAGVEVRAFGEEGAAEPGFYPARADATGHYRMLGGRPGQAAFYLRARGYAILTTERRRIGAGTQQVDFELWPTRPVQVRVVDAGGHALQGVSVEAVDPVTSQPLTFQDENGGDEGEKQVTDLAGRALLRGLPARQVELVVAGEADGFRVNAWQPRGAAARAPRTSFGVDLTARHTDEVVLRVAR